MEPHVLAASLLDGVRGLMKKVTEGFLDNPEDTPRRSLNDEQEGAMRRACCTLDQADAFLHGRGIAPPLAEVNWALKETTKLVDASGNKIFEINAQLVESSMRLGMSLCTGEKPPTMQEMLLAAQVLSSAARDWTEGLGDRTEALKNNGTESPAVHCIDEMSQHAGNLKVVSQLYGVFDEKLNEAQKVIVGSIAAGTGEITNILNKEFASLQRSVKKSAADTKKLIKQEGAETRTEIHALGDTLRAFRTTAAGEAFRNGQLVAQLRVESKERLKAAEDHAVAVTKMMEDYAAENAERAEERAAARLAHSKEIATLKAEHRDELAEERAAARLALSKEIATLRAKANAALDTLLMNATKVSQQLKKEL